MGCTGTSYLRGSWQPHVCFITKETWLCLDMEHHTGPFWGEFSNTTILQHIKHILSCAIFYCDTFCIYEHKKEWKKAPEMTWYVVLATRIFSLTYSKLSKIISRKYTMPETTFMVIISSRNSVRVSKAYKVSDWNSHKQRNFWNTQILENSRSIVKHHKGTKRFRIFCNETAQAAVNDNNDSVVYLLWF